ncbi:sugar phosphate nucleotidyltransferase [Bacillus pseudomycoides]|uniref:sugar phosphate nucleotidyltransferase n=1 Tax=Bacillus pseudomycoides TaxID=64104 RepID=UPI000BEE657F|nr:sugar phosphate nucleotidyltransferase [Bacillus pseudomycoides]PEE35511.1 glucose-1-phosphate adenylyltransferase [Bacillus pseudomycoides]PGA94740.1 glucose-1-phosphate adenylyltransferase [Bacillus pseudomycoides]PHF47439.1 glucose-1-phosphate adenylyltransferase [Bacillus pseudomycoides]
MGESMLGIINATGSFSSLKKVTGHRSLAALPFGGRYRLIDFMLSNMVNSHIHSVAIFTSHKNRSLMDHLGSGKQWDLDRKRDGLFLFPPNCQCDQDEFGSFAHFRRHIDYFLRSRQEYIVITNSHLVTALNFQEVLERHIHTGADVTEVCHEGISLQTYVLKKQLLLDLFETYEDIEHYSLFDVVKEKRGESLYITTYEHTGYVAVIDSIENYYKHSLEILQPSIWKQLFTKEAPIFTKVKDEPPTRYIKGAQVQNTMIANGSVIAGKVENSVVFRSVKVGKGSVIRNSIIMQKSQIGDNCILDGVIIDKDVKIEDGVILTGTPDNPYVLKKGSVQSQNITSYS